MIQKIILLFTLITLVFTTRMEIDNLGLDKEYCVDNFIQDLPKLCEYYDNRCKDCFDIKYITKCLTFCKGQQDQSDCQVKCSNDLDSECFSLVEKCTDCYNQWKECTCPTGTTLSIYETGERKCTLENCSKGYYRAQDSKCTTCYPCEKECAVCQYFPNHCQECEDGYCLYEDKCVDPSIYRCPNSQVKFYEAGVKCPKCIDECPEGYYRDEELGLCVKCPEHCTLCTSKDKCTHCDALSCLIDDLCQTFDFKCKDGTYKLVPAENSCFQCIPCENCPTKSYCDKGSNTCNPLCQLPNFIYKHDCIRYCPQGTFLIYSDTFENDCVTCPNCPLNQYCNKVEFKCDDCPSPKFIWEKDCLDTCPEGSYKEFNILTQQIECVKKCKDGYFGNEKNRICEQCSDNCVACISSADTCLPPCRQGLIFKENKCVPDCGEGYFSYTLDVPEIKACDLAVDKQCFCGKCHKSCKTCIGPETPSSTQCTECAEENKYLWQGICYGNCAETKIPTYPDELEKQFVCSCCHKNCAKCFGPAVNQCDSCNPGYTQIKKTCYQKVGSNGSQVVMP